MIIRAPKATGGGWLDGAMTLGVDPASNLATAGAGLKYTSSNFLREGYWRGANGKYYPLSLTQKGAQGWRIYEGSANMAKNSVRWISFTGQGLGYLSLGYSGYKLFSDPTLSNGVDFGVSVASIAFWEVGTFYYGISLSIQADRSTTNFEISKGMNPCRYFTIGKE